MERIKAVLAYIYSERLAEEVERVQMRVELSRTTGRVKHVFSHGRMMFTLRAQDGYLLPTIHAGPLLRDYSVHVVKVTKDAAEYVKRGRNVPARHVLYVSESLRAGAEVVVVDPDGEPVAVGRLMASPSEVRSIGRGYAVRVRDYKGG